MPMLFYGPAKDTGYGVPCQGVRTVRIVSTTRVVLYKRRV